MESTLGIAPLFDIDALKAFLKSLFSGNVENGYKIIAFILYSSLNRDIAKFIKQNGDWLHHASGKDCLICVFENPTKWGDNVKDYWRKKLGENFDKYYIRTLEATELNRNFSYELADDLGIAINMIPGIIFSESYPTKKILYIPIIADENRYFDYFKDIFAATSIATKGKEGERLISLQKKWEKLWIKWILPQKTKEWAKSVQEWGSIIKDTEGTFLGVINPIGFFLKKG